MNNRLNIQNELNHFPTQNLINSNSLISGRVPYGFEIKRRGSQDKESLGAMRYLNQVEREIKNVNIIHSLSYTALTCISYTCQSIADELNEFAVIRKIGGGKWSAKQVEDVLTNRIYFDCDSFILRRKNKQDELFIINNLPIIPAQIFQANQLRFNNRSNQNCLLSTSSNNKVKSSKLRTKKLKTTNISEDEALLSGLCVCGTCKSRLILIKTGAGFKYVCSKENIKDYDFCNFTPVEQLVLEAKIVTFLRRTAFKRGFANVTNQQVIEKIGLITKKNICKTFIKSKKDSTVRIKLVPVNQQ
jgi:hypothetical protein